jgi:hypothetical protein
MAMNKSKKTFNCFVHVLIYTACFLILTTSWKALLVIGVTHFILDRWPVILKRIIWIKNHVGPHFLFVPYSKCDVTGYYDNIKNEVEGKEYEAHYCNEWKDGKGNRQVVSYNARLNYITIWLYIITDNSLHLFINYMALKYLV